MLLLDQEHKKHLQKQPTLFHERILQKFRGLSDRWFGRRGYRPTSQHDEEVMRLNVNQDGPQRV